MIAAVSVDTKSKFTKPFSDLSLKVQNIKTHYVERSNTAMTFALYIEN